MTITARSPTIASQVAVTGATTATDDEHGCNLRLPAKHDRQRDLGRDLIVAWFRPMGAAEVAYHQATVVGREDDHPGRALAYYGSRGETPLCWGGAGATRLGLSGEVTPEAYEAAFGTGGFRNNTNMFTSKQVSNLSSKSVAYMPQSVVVISLFRYMEETPYRWQVK